MSTSKRDQCPVTVKSLNMKQPLPLVTAQFRTGFAEPRPEKAVLTFWP